MATVNLVEATEAAFKAATHLTAADAGAKAALLALARKIDAWDVIVDWAFEDASEDESRPKVPANDNVSISAYLKGCDQLGLTPAGRAALAKGAAGAAPKASSKMATLTALQGGKSA